MLIQQGSNRSSQEINNQQNNGINQALQTINQIKSSKNPNQMLQMLATKNPKVANAINLANKYGGDYQKAFYEEAKRLGINPNQILGLLK